MRVVSIRDFGVITSIYLVPDTCSEEELKIKVSEYNRAQCGNSGGVTHLFAMIHHVEEESLTHAALSMLFSQNTKNEREDKNDRKDNT